MKVIAVSRKSKALTELLKQARNANVLVQSEEGEQFVLAKVASTLDFNVGRSKDFVKEVKATRANKRLMKYLDQRGAQAKPGKDMRIEEVRAKLEVK